MGHVAVVIGGVVCGIIAGAIVAALGTPGGDRGCASKLAAAFVIGVLVIGWLKGWSGLAASAIIAFIASLLFFMYGLTAGWGRGGRSSRQDE